MCTNSLNPHITEPLNRNLRAFCRNCVLNKYWCSSNQMRCDHERSNANLELKWRIWNRNWVNRTKTSCWAIAKFDFYGTTFICDAFDHVHWNTFDSIAGIWIWRKRRKRNCAARTKWPENWRNSKALVKIGKKQMFTIEKRKKIKINK